MNNHRLCTEISTETNHRNVSGEGIGHRLSMTNGLSYPECQVFGRLAFCVPVTDLSDVDDLLPTDVHDKASTVGFLVYRFDRTTRQYQPDGNFYESSDHAVLEADWENQRLFHMIHGISPKIGKAHV